MFHDTRQVFMEQMESSHADGDQKNSLEQLEQRD
jgi:hypothetical protein